jgi:translocation and assembly module TamB
MNGRVAARGLGYVRDRLHIEDGSLRANVQLSKDRLTLREIEGEALNTAITGNVELVAWRRFAMQGNIQGMGLRRAAGILTGHAIAWSGTLSGPFRLEATLGESEARAQANLTVTRGGDGVPVEGHLDVAYDQAAGIVGLGSSWLATPETRLDVSGTLGQVLRVRLRTTEPEDLLPALAMAQADAPEHLPLKLTSSGTATAEGTVTGPLDELHFEGPVTVVNGEVQGHQFSRFAADVAADRREIRASRLTLSRGAMETTGSANLAARNGSFDDATLSAALSARSLALAELAREFGLNTPVSGTASATARVSGSVRAPEAEIQADVDRPEAFGEQFSRLRATLRYKPDSLEVAGGEAQDGTATVQFGGVYRPAAGGWKSGELSFDAATQNLPLQRIDRVAAIQPPVDALVTGRVRGSVRISENEILPRTLTADLAADRVAVDRQNAGTFSLGVETRGNEIQALITGRVRESAIEARGVWTLAGDYPGTATINVSRMSIATVHSLSMLGSGAELHEDDVPFEGFLEGGAALSIPLRSLKDFSARVTLAAVQVNPKPNQALRLGVEPQDIVLRNERPVVVEITPQEARIAQAQFTGRDTSLQVSGAIPFGAGRSADVAVRGNINLILLQLLNRDLLARGEASMQAAVRGEIRDPVVNGRLELKNASLYFGDLPQGIDNANGSILFDRNRASVEKLTAQTGGGTLAVSGLVEFGSTLVYRLQADARQVRVRWPEDLSTTFNARLGLSGTPEATTLSGTVTLNRAAFTPRTDLGQLLAQASKPAPALATPNELLRGLQFNVRVESAPNFTFETSLTRDVEADVDLNLRGTPTRPVLLGAISVNQGELQVFGNRYTIDRGEVRFLNPVKIEPTFDMDLATRARGITVNVSFSGTVQQLKVNYSSDPPLQSSEIIALLAVGRDPTTANTTTVNPSATSGLVEAGSSLIGQAANAQLSSRLQRFFGASRVKIDPTLTGVDNLPQARLTIEQQVSRDITLTYITNLNRTQEQLVRVQWDLNRNWSAIAVRDPNGLFGLDFQFRTRF